jgi:hypothetical protein
VASLEWLRTVVDTTHDMSPTREDRHVRHLTPRTAATAAAAALLLGCAGDGGEDGSIALDAPATDSTPEAIEDDGDDGGGEVADAPADAGTTRAVDGAAAVPGTWQVGDAGTVTFDIVDGALVLEDVSENEGWTVTGIDEDSDEIEVDFRRGDVEVEIEIELGSGGSILEVEIDTDIENAEPGTYDIGDAGSFTFDVVDGRLELVDLVVNEGWEVTEQDVGGDEIEIELRNGAMRWDADVDLNGTIEVELDHEVSGQV